MLGHSNAAGSVSASSEKRTSIHGRHRYALLSWAAVGVPVLTSALVVTPSLWWWIAYLGYGLLLAGSAIPAVGRRRILVRAMLALQVVLGLTAFLLDGGYGFRSYF